MFSHWLWAKAPILFHFGYQLDFSSMSSKPLLIKSVSHYWVFWLEAKKNYNEKSPPYILPCSPGIWWLVWPDQSCIPGPWPRQLFHPHFTSKSPALPSPIQLSVDLICYFTAFSRTKGFLGYRTYIAEKVPGKPREESIQNSVLSQSSLGIILARLLHLS